MDQNHVLKNAARIWTFDGGGPNVISQLIIVNEIMHQVQWVLKLDSVPRPCEYAELMVGSGLGAVVAILLARLGLTAEQTLIHLIELGQSVFLEPNESADGCQFDAKTLRMWITNLLERHGLTDTTRMIEDSVTTGQTYTAVTSTPTSNLSHCRLIRTYHTPSAEYSCTIIEAVLAAMAFPNWFRSVRIGPVHSQESLTGGALGFNNPTKKALEEAKQVFGTECKVSVVLSLGSGRRPPQCLEDTTKDRSRQALDDMAHRGEQTVTELSQRFEDSTFYRRFSVDSGLEATSITGWTNEELEVITSHTKVYIEKVLSVLSTTVESLVGNEGSVTLGQLTQVEVKSAKAKSIPRLSPFFIERKDVLEFMERRLLHDTCGSQRMFVIHGMGGSGKTQAASYFARRNKNRYIFFIDASSEATIKADLQSAVRSLGGVHSQDSHEDAIHFLTQQENRDWLVIFDNSDDPELPLAQYLPECDHGTVIITSRNRTLVHLSPTSQWHLQGMEESDAIQLLRKAANIKASESHEKEELKAATELWSLLGGLPLALVHVGCYCVTTMISFVQYLDRFKTHRSKLMTMEPPLQLDKYSYSTYTSIGLSYSLLNEHTRGLLHLLTFFHPSSICLDILRTASKYGFRVVAEWVLLPINDQYNDQLDALRWLLTPGGSWSDVHTDTLLNRLQTFSLISLSHSNGQTNITIHPLVQSCIRDTLSTEMHILYFYMAVLTLSSCSRRDEIGLFQLLPAHIAELENCIDDIPPNELGSLAYIIFMGGSYAEAMKRWEKVRDECGKVNGEEHRSTLRMSYWIAECLQRTAKYGEAEVVIRWMMRIQERVLGQDHDDTIESHQLLADILNELYKTEEAEGILKHLLIVSESKDGREHWRTLQVQWSLATNLLIQQRHPEAEALSRDVLPVMKRVIGEDDAITLDTMNILSLALIRQGKWAEAEVILSEEIAKRKTNYGRHHPETLVALLNFALCLIEREELDEAEIIIQDVLEVWDKILGKDHPHTMKTRRRLEDVIRRKEIRRLSNIQSPNSRDPSSFSNHISSRPSHDPKQRSKSRSLWKLFRSK